MSFLSLIPFRLRRGPWTTDYPVRVGAGLRPQGDAAAVAERIVAEHAAERSAAFEEALAEFDRPRLTTAAVLDLYLARVMA